MTAPAALDVRDNPFVGLRPFFDEDALYFFGRSQQSMDLLDLLRETRFVPVLGSSGSGKSSLVRAGVIPMLQAGFMVADRDRWRLAKCKPGDAPLENLAESLIYAMGEGRDAVAAAALADRIRIDHSEAVVSYLAPRLAASENVFILVDQFEELFAFRLAAGSDSEDEAGATRDTARTAERIRRREESSALVSLLLALAQQTEIPVYISMTMRTDFLGDCDVFSGLPEAINRSGYLVPRLTRAQLRESVIGPARLLGARVAPRLIDRVLNDVGDRGDRLPIMQHALMRTWELWRAAGKVGPLDLHHFEKAGGLEHALHWQAEATVSSADARMVERIFKRLTTTDVNRRRVRSPARFSELVRTSDGEAAGVRSLLDRCRAEGVNFVFVAADGKPDDPRYDIAHESLIRQWTRLRQWVDEERDTRDWWLETARKAHADSQSPGDDLLSPRELQVASERLARRMPTAEWAERYASTSATSFADTMQYITKSRTASRRRRMRRLRTVGAVGAGFVALIIWGLVTGAQAESYLRTANTLSRNYALERLAVEDPTYAAALAAEFEPADLSDPLRLELVQQVLVRTSALAEYPGTFSSALSDAGDQLALGYTDGLLVLEPSLGAGARVYAQLDSTAVFDLRFSRDARSVLVASGSGKLRRVSRDSGGVMQEWQVSAQPLRSVRESADGQYLAAIDERGILSAWRANDARIVPLEIGEMTLAEFDPRRPQMLVAVAAEGALIELDLSSKERQPRVIAPLGDNVAEFLVFSQDGNSVLLGGRNSPTWVYQRSGEGGPRTLNTRLASGAAFSPDGAWLAIGTATGMVDLYSATDMSLQWRVAAHSQHVLPGFSANSQAVISISSDRTGRWTPVGDTARAVPLLGHRSDILSMQIARSGTRFTTLDLNGTLRVWDTPTDWGGFAPVTALGTPSGMGLSGNGEVAVTAFASGTLLAQFPIDDRTPVLARLADDSSAANLKEILISPDGSGALLLFWGGFGPKWWTMNTAAPRALDFGETPESVVAAAFSGDGQTLVLAHSDGRLTRADKNGRVIGDERAACGDYVMHLAVSHDGRRIAAQCVQDSILLITPDRAWMQAADSVGNASVLRFSPDGSLLHVAGSGVSSLLIETLGAHRTVRLSGTQSNISTTAFSHDGLRLATGSPDKSVEMYTLPSFSADSVFNGYAVFADTLLEAHRMEVLDVRFSDDDSLLVSTGGNGIVRLWKVHDHYKSMELAHPEPLATSIASPRVQTVHVASAQMIVSLALLLEEVVPTPAQRHAAGDLTAPFMTGTARYRRWDLNPESLLTRVRERTTACIPVDQRQRLMVEQRADAQKRTATCERRNGREP